MICPIKNSDAWKFHEANNTNDYLTWNLNNGNPLNLDKDGNPSVIFDQLLKNINSDRESNPFDKFLNESIKNKLQRLYPEIDLTYSNNPIWEKGNAIMNQSDIDSAIKYKLKTIDILQSPRAEQMFAKGEKAKWDLNKILTELAIPKEQKALLLDLGISDREQLALELASNYGYSVEVNTTKENSKLPQQPHPMDGEKSFVVNGDKYSLISDVEFDEDGATNITKAYKNDIEISIEEYLKGKKLAADKGINTSFYSNLTVPGGTNYTENEISTPLITPRIKGHAAFATDKGIGWFRSDDKGVEIKDNVIVDLEDIIEKEGFTFIKNAGDTTKGEYAQFNSTGNIYIKNVSVDYIKSLLSNKQSTKTRRILEVQSDLFQKGRDSKTIVETSTIGDKLDTLLNDLDNEAPYNGWSAEKLKEEQNKLIDKYTIPLDTNKNQFLQLLNKDSNWVTFFIKSIIQDTAKKGYEKVLFPKGETAAKIEGHETIANRFVAIDKEIQKIELQNTELEADPDKYTNAKRAVENNNKRISELQQEKVDLKSQGVEKLKPIETFYEIKVGNILEKQFGKDNIKTITDEYGNQWREITINHARDLSNILLQKNESEKIIGQANIKAMSVLIDAVNQKQDTLPHEYAHHYIAWYRENPIVKKAIEKWGSEEKLVQAIGEQVVKQKGEAFDWWNQFSKWLINKFSNLSTMQKEDLKNILTDAFLKREDLDKNITSNNNNFKDFTTFELSEEEKSLEEELRKNCSL